jgi:hypothetical protein
MLGSGFDNSALVSVIGNGQAPVIIKDVDVIPAEGGMRISFDLPSDISRAILSRSGVSYSAQVIEGGVASNELSLTSTQ